MRKMNRSEMMAWHPAHRGSESVGCFLGRRRSPMGRLLISRFVLEKMMIADRVESFNERKAR